MNKWNFLLKTFFKLIAKNYNRDDLIEFIELVFNKFVKNIKNQNKTKKYLYKQWNKITLFVEKIIKREPICDDLEPKIKKLIEFNLYSSIYLVDVLEKRFNELIINIKLYDTSNLAMQWGFVNMLAYETIKLSKIKFKGN